jgi:hypothetical protein
MGGVTHAPRSVELAACRAIDEQNERKAEREERRRIYEENYQREERALRNRVLDDLKAVARGDKVRLDPEAVEAAKQIMERQGVNNPGASRQASKTVETWTALIDDLSAETLEDAKAIQERLDELLYPETLEDISRSAARALCVKPRSVVGHGDTQRLALRSRTRSADRHSIISARGFPPVSQLPNSVRSSRTGLRYVACRH